MARSNNGCIEYCPRCGAGIIIDPIYARWTMHFFKCGVAIRTNTRGGGFSCACGVMFRHHKLFSQHLRDVDHDWEKLAVRRVMESM